jgi:hypothetical protein
LGIHKRGKAKRQPRNASPERPALGLVESAWFFTRGDQSVRIVRVGHRDGGRRLLVQGPGPSRVVHDFEDVVACTIHQSELERRLVARSFRLLRFVGAAVTESQVYGVARADAAPRARRGALPELMPGA